MPATSAAGEGIRLQKVLAHAGVGSRRACEQLIVAGRVSVDGRVVSELGTRVDPYRAVVRVDGARVNVRDDLVYLALNKPRGVLSAMSDSRGRRTVGDLVADHGPGLFHVGRLDADSEGLLLVTNDGELAHRLTHPSYGVAKTYLATVPGPVPRNLGARLRAGVRLDDGPVHVDGYRLVDQHGGQAIVEIVLHEGRKHIVRRLLAELGHPVRRLVRTAIGPVRLGNQRPGTVRVLGPAQLRELYRAADAAPRENSGAKQGADVRILASGPGPHTSAGSQPSTTREEYGTVSESYPGETRDDAEYTEVLTLDGPSGTGKSTVARRVAQRLGARYLDTGAMYRAAALAVLRAHVDPADAGAVTAVVENARIEPSTDPGSPSITLDGEPVDAQIRTAEVTAAVSAVSAVPAVRAVLVAAQREIIGDGGIVVEGRDIGSVVWPTARSRVYLTASAAVRARRRAGEIGRIQDVSAVAADIEHRDRLDSTRAASPLRRPEGSLEVDTTQLGVDEVVERLVDVARTGTSP